MAEELLSLKWNNHQSHFVDILTYLREKDMFIDATIACGGKVYSAHKFVLSTCSDYFKQIFTRNTSNNPIVFMKDVSSRDIEALLDFMYHGEVNVPQSSLGSLIKTAEGLQIKGLAVPDDPPSSRRDQERDKRERDHSSYLESPPPKRRVRDRALSPSRRHNTSSSNNVSHSNSRTNRTSSPLDSSSRTGEDKSSNVNSNSDHHQSSTNSEKAVNNSSSKSGSNSVKHSIDEDDRGGGSKGSVSGRGEPEAGEIGEGEGTHDDHNDTEDSMDNNSNAGPSSMVATTHSKTEEMEIKQEDVVELAEDDDDDGGAGDWLSGDHGAGSHDGGLGSDNFPDMLMPHSGDMGGGGMGGSSSSGNPSDSAMVIAGRFKHHHHPTSSSHHQHPLLHDDDGGGGDDDSQYSSVQCDDGREEDDGYHQSALSYFSSTLSESCPSFFGPANDGSSTSSSYFQPSSVSVKLKQSSSHRSEGSVSPGTSDAFGSGGAGTFATFPADKMHSGSSKKLRSKPYPCPMCDRVLLFKSEFEKHMRIHTGEKPYVCHLCPYRSAQVSNLNVHLKQVHKIVKMPNRPSM